MIRLEIDGREVALAADASFDIEYKNPFFTKEGEMTYDIDIYLDAGNNAVLYGHLDRDTVTVRPEGRRAVLYDGPRVLVSGKEIVLSVEDGVAKVQILGDNSELNYLAGGDTSIRDMDFGEMLNDYESWEEVNPAGGLGLCYPEVSSLYSTFLIPTGDGTYNVRNGFIRQSDNGSLLPSNPEDVPWVKQPFLLYYVEKIVELLGYRLGENDLRGTEAWLHLMVTNPIFTHDFADVLPDWTADEFLSQVEHFFNCFFMVDQSHKTVHIKYVKSFYSNRPVTELGEVLDGRSVEFDDTSDNLYLTYCNVNYDLQDSIPYKIADIDGNVRAASNQFHVNTLEDLRAIPKETYFDRYYIFNVNSPRATFIIRKAAVTGNIYWAQADYLRPIEDPDSSDSCSLKIIPAPIISQAVRYDATTDVYVTRPAAYNALYEPERTGFQEAVESGMEEEHHPDRLYVSFYLGLRPVFTQEGGVGPYTLPQNATLPVHYNSFPYPMDHTEVMPVSLSLREDYHGMYDQFYQGNENIDTSKRCTFTFVSEKILDPKDYFLIHDKLYYCKVLKYKVEDGELSKLVEGEFFPVE